MATMFQQTTSDALRDYLRAFGAREKTLEQFIRCCLRRKGIGPDAELRAVAELGLDPQLASRVRNLLQEKASMRSDDEVLIRYVAQWTGVSAESLYRALRNREGGVPGSWPPSSPQKAEVKTAFRTVNRPVAATRAATQRAGVVPASKPAMTATVAKSTPSTSLQPSEGVKPLSTNGHGVRQLYGRDIKSVREKYGITQSELARRIGSTASAVNQWSYRPDKPIPEGRSEQILAVLAQLKPKGAEAEKTAGDQNGYVQPTESSVVEVPVAPSANVDEGADRQLYGRDIKPLCEKYGISQAKLGSLVGATAKAVNQWVYKKDKPIPVGRSAEVLRALSKLTPKVDKADATQQSLPITLPTVNGKPRDNEDVQRTVTETTKTVTVTAETSWMERLNEKEIHPDDLDLLRRLAEWMDAESCSVFKLAGMLFPTVGNTTVAAWFSGYRRVTLRFREQLNAIMREGSAHSVVDQNAIREVAQHLILADKVRDERQKAGMTLAEFSAASGLSLSTLFAIEKGRGSHEYNTLQKISNALGVPIVISPMEVDSLTDAIRLNPKLADADAWAERKQATAQPDVPAAEPAADTPVETVGPVDQPETAMVVEQMAPSAPPAETLANALLDPQWLKQQLDRVDLEGVEQFEIRIKSERYRLHMWVEPL